MLQVAQALIEQFSHALGIPGLALDEDGMTTLRMGDGLLVQVAYDASSGELIFSAVVHPEASDLPPAALRRMLITNVKLHAESGPAFAIVPDEGSVVLEQHIPLTDLAYSQFEEIWTTFLDQVERARAKLGQLVDSTAMPKREGEPKADENLFILRA